MKIAKRIGILILLTICLLAIKGSSVSQAKTNDCPEKDQCYDAANAGYSGCIGIANGIYSQCTNSTNAVFDVCRSSATQQYAICESRANNNAQTNYYDCIDNFFLSIDDWTDVQDCFLEADQYLQSDLEWCSAIRSREIDYCYSVYGANDAYCSFEFFRGSNICDANRNNRWRECDGMCP